MTQIYHSNARTNQHQRKIIQHSTSTNIELAKRVEFPPPKIN